MMALDFATQLQEMKAIAGQPDYALEAHTVRRGRNRIWFGRGGRPHSIEHR
jgi:hypothetical protein